MLKKTSIILPLVFLLFLSSIASADNMTDDEITLQLSGLRDGKSYDVNFYITHEKAVIFFHKSLGERKCFDTSYIYNFTNKDLKKVTKLMVQIKSLKNYEVSYVMKSYNITKFYLRSSANTITAYAGEDDFDTSSIQRLIALIISKASGKLDFLHSHGLFSGMLPIVAGVRYRLVSQVFSA